MWKYYTHRTGLMKYKAVLHNIMGTFTCKKKITFWSFGQKFCLNSLYIRKYNQYLTNISRFKKGYFRKYYIIV